MKEACSIEDAARDLDGELVDLQHQAVQSRGRRRELVAVVGVRDRGEGARSLADRPARELGDAELGDDRAGVVPGRGDDRARWERRHDAAAALTAHRRGRAQAHERAVLGVEVGARHEVLVSADARDLASVDRVGDDLAVQVDLDRAVDRDDAGGCRRMTDGSLTTDTGPKATSGLSVEPLRTARASRGRTW